MSLQGSRRKGKIPHAEWASIRARRGAGEAFASIARDYGCTAPAICYIVTGGAKRREASREPRAPSAPPAPAVPRSDEPPEPPLAGETAKTPWLLAAACRSQSEGAFDAKLRERVTGDVASFLVALDPVVLRLTPEGLGNLREATDRLMRAAARTRIEVERVAARAEARTLDLAGPPVVQRIVTRRS